jgi:threonine/homoserine/homoserine lactone efflux protein
MKASTLIMAAAILLVSSHPGLAYVGPGLGIGVLGAIFGLLLSIVLAIVVLLRHAFKRMLRLGKRRNPHRRYVQQRQQGNASKS